MKNISFLLSIILLSLSLQGQRISQIPPEKASLKVPARTVYPGGGELPFSKEPNAIVSSKSTLDDPVLMTGTYDLMTNGSVQNRFYVYPDGKMGGVESFSTDLTGSFADRGTGYNYYNGTAWGAKPTSRLESVRTGWPSYAPWNGDGEIVVSHHFALFPLIKMTRPVKGTGTWTQSEIPNPAGSAGMDWPRMVTNGPTHNYVHVIALTTPTANSGVAYQGLDGALLYNRSLDGGANWEGWRLLDGMTSTDYLGFTADSYSIAEPRGDTLCFVVASNWYDGFIMKSIDNGATWTKTKFWTHPFPNWAGPDTTGVFYCPDASNAVAVDKNGKAHVAFGLQRASGDAAGSKYYYPWTDGLIYWNEDMPELPQDLNPDTLFSHGNYIGWCPDTMVFYANTTELAYYYLSMSSMPSIRTINDKVVVVWSGVTNFRDPSNLMFRHIFFRYSYDLNNSWCSEFGDMTADFIYNFSECVYPYSASIKEGPFLQAQVEFMADPEAGVYINGTSGAQGQSSITNNDIVFMDAYLFVGIDEKQRPELRVSQFSPNPASVNTIATVQLIKPENTRLEMFSITGVRIISIDKGSLPAGTTPVTLDVSALSPGLYFCRLTAGQQTEVRKIVVE
jgi:hypothetical protein